MVPLLSPVILGLAAAVTVRRYGTEPELQRRSGAAFAGGRLRKTAGAHTLVLAELTFD
jgi:hypothetical protein